MRFSKLVFCTITLALALGSGHGRAQAPEKKQLTLGVGGKTALYYLPLTICERLGYFKEQGLDVTINDFRGGAQSLQALVNALYKTLKWLEQATPTEIAAAVPPPYKPGHGRSTYPRHCRA